MSKTGDLTEPSLLGAPPPNPRRSGGVVKPDGYLYLYLYVLTIKVFLTVNDCRLTQV